MGCAEKLIKDELRQNIVYRLGHLNGWGGAQQAKMRQAAILGQLIPDSVEGRSRAKFITEGEAALHFCLFVEKVRFPS